MATLQAPVECCFGPLLAGSSSSWPRCTNAARARANQPVERSYAPGTCTWTLTLAEALTLVTCLGGGGGVEQLDDGGLDCKQQNMTMMSFFASSVTTTVSTYFIGNLCVIANWFSEGRCACRSENTSLPTCQPTHKKLLAVPTHVCWFTNPPLSTHQQVHTHATTH